jgi:hypothetical protein
VVSQNPTEKPLENFSSVLILGQIHAPIYPLSNAEHWNSIAISITEIFNKQPSTLYFEMDNSNWNFVSLILWPAKAYL